MIAVMRNRCLVVPLLSIAVKHVGREANVEVSIRSAEADLPASVRAAGHGDRDAGGAQWTVQVGGAVVSQDVRPRQRAPVLRWVPLAGRCSKLDVGRGRGCGRAWAS